MRLRRGSALLGSALLVSACGGGGGNAGVPPGPHGGGSSVPSTGILPVNITVPLPSSSGSGAKRRPAYVSEGTQSLAVFVYPSGSAQPTTPSATLNISPQTAGCSQNVTANSISCTLNVSAPIGSAVVTLQAMSGQDGTGNVLSQATQGVTISVGMSPIAFTLQGVLAQILLSLETPVLAAGTPGSSILDVNGIDAAGEIIVAPGNFASPVTIASDSTDVSLSSSTAAAPGTHVTITYGGGAAPYAVHLSGTGGGIASNLLVGSTLYIAPSQSMVVFSTQGSNSGGVTGAATVATTATTVEPPQSVVPLGATSTFQPQAGGVAVLPNGEFVVAADNNETDTCQVTLYSTSGAVLATSPYQGGVFSPTDCTVASTSSGNIVIGDGGANEESFLQTFSVSSNNVLSTAISTIVLEGPQIPSGQLADYFHAVNASGEIAVVGQGSDDNYYVLVYPSNATGTVAPTQTVELTAPASSYVSGLALASNGSFVVGFSTTSGYTLQQYSPTGTLEGTITSPTTYPFLYGSSIAIDSANEILVGWSGGNLNSNNYSQGVNAYAPGLYGTAVTPTRVTPLAFDGSILGPVIVPAPTIPSAEPTVSGDMIAYAPSRAWTYLITPQDGSTPYYIGLYADPNLVNGNERFVGFQSATSNPFSGGTLIGNIDFAQLPGWYEAVDFTSVSSGVTGVSGSIPGSPLFVPGSLTLGQTWNPLANAAISTFTGVSAAAQVTSVGAVPGMSACPNSPAQGAAVQYTASTAQGNLGYSTLYYVPGCGMTALAPSQGGPVAVLQSVTTQSQLGQQIVPPGQPPIVAALHKLWQHTLGRLKPPK